MIDPHDAPKDYPLPRAERRPEEYDGDGCMIGMVIVAVVFGITFFAAGYWFAGFMA